eukprot:gnl/TRDRNA2_/TRDRNA2_168772_c1_seq3.p1 gnl/TRDRNA2_/TRDRNA2_168772_c1~~gnl/TRDRNA2_/TRDRNA2_168772_c1_seq3.p1  ORF type:complete len:104 (-),score=7.69 gnl/TRDRNA2_/TRDRNA2_168772_c1_seq3:69-335(-)
MLLLARTGDSDTPRKSSLTVFLLDMRAQGSALTINPISTMMNHNSTSIFFDGCRVHSDSTMVSKPLKQTMVSKPLLTLSSTTVTCFAR